ncbi:aldose 1-epimerase [Wenyingzhuangia marina]|uniref:Aldose 1-epimerase n=1 Tax=Wenyingzhuangia marina TaxID=1195760 RepID=A0A1M5T4S3_9FLAO|nr:aldose 1-epimerase [Wenyingzhuangia marina]GGF65382.1 aldose epimerase [Wenyingzhuangia marina]SHH45761.1 aldose 1-epimerase [Wenyingzhuangia marina]
MYKINKLQENGLNYIEIVEDDYISSAKICLDRGGALETLTLNRQSVIVDLHPLDYKNTYASSILFPFANRIKDGKYTYKDVKYQFDCNEVNNNNALHGLVYNKSFVVVDSEISDEDASVTMVYTASTRNKAFPYLFTIALKFTLTDNSLDLHVEVDNNDINSFPFTIGWHPYFLSDDLYNSTLNFTVAKTIEFDERMITKNVIEGELEMPIEIKDQQLDNCYALSDGKVVFNTPKYKMTIDTSGDENFFQMYTPPKENVIALEPVTGVSDSFNNKLGLQELKAADKYEINWTVTVE